MTMTTLILNITHLCTNVNSTETTILILLVCISGVSNGDAVNDDDNHDTGIDIIVVDVINDTGIDIKDVDDNDTHEKNGSDDKLDCNVR